MDKALLMLSQVDGWKAKKVELESTIRDAEQELAEISRKLDAAAVLMEVENQPTNGAEPVKAREADDLPPVTMGDRIVRVVGLHSSGATPNDIRNSLRAEGFDMTALDRNSSYLYTALSRLVKRGKLEKRRGKYRVPQKISSQDGTGAVAAPARHQRMLDV